MKPVALKKRFPFSPKRALPLNAALPILSLLWLATPANAADLSAHEHGVANLALAQDGNEVSVIFSAAADSVIGYEHAPTNDKELEALHHAESVFNRPDKWLKLPVSCELEELSVSLPFLAALDAHDKHGHDHEEHDHEEHGHDHEEHDHEEHGHDHEEHGHDHEEHDHEEHGHDHEEHDHEEHGHDHEEHDHEEHSHEHKEHDHASGHVDVKASYTFHCDSDQASPLELNLFSQLPYLELLRIEAVSERTVVVTEREGDGSLDW
ncbi:ZrgA family zinc uptake protein [Oceanospirillum sanctuarii]|uniref:ZrgA family zinc uptake protein n=1 Tax=Oceanospirillum sanctuarii TaxID=1434821 RepID=UPI000A3C62F6|nr:DUF2796 domain-containing protein [Oceanospirillum sanctuarii]